MKTQIILLLTTLSTLAQEPSIERLDAALDALIAPDAKVETIATGFRWTEGPAWNAATSELLFSDIPNNVINAWSPESGLRIFMKPSGYTGITDYGREPGSNGLAFDQKGRLVLCEHGDRRIAVLTPNGGKMTAADRFESKRFNSPNDLVVHSSGAIYFTDPIYGLTKGESDPNREIDFCGVYRIGTDGKVSAIIKNIERPNGLAFSPDERILYVANSHGPKPYLYSYAMTADGGVDEGKIFFDMNSVGKGGPDGLKTDGAGDIWSTGPGGLLIISREGKLLGRVLTYQPTSNIAFGGVDGKSVFLTANDRILRFPRR
jgi:gluconolactonase